MKVEIKLTDEQRAQLEALAPGESLEKQISALLIGHTGEEGEA